MSQCKQASSSTPEIDYVVNALETLGRVLTRAVITVVKNAAILICCAVWTLVKSVKDRTR